MAEERSGERIAGTGLVACVEETMAIGTFRYFDRRGPFVQALQSLTGAALPEPLAARELAGEPLILAWRSPSETLCLSRSAAALTELTDRLGVTPDGCAVDLTGGVRVVRLTGARIADLICRLGAAASVPAPGEARRSRLADVPVLAVSVREGETLLAVDRAYLPHLLAWIRATVLDFAAA